MGFIEVAVVTSPFANLTPIYEVDPDADVLLIVPGPPSTQALAPQDGLGIRLNGPNDQDKARNLTSAAQSGLRIKVSSRHLALASRVFQNKLQFGAGKGVRQSDGRVHLKLAEEFDPKAVSIVMNIIHSRGSKVPKTVDLETLAQTALVVDRFQLYDAVEVYAERWISNLESSHPDTVDHDPIPWIYISHIFRHAAIFKAATKLAAAQSTGPIPTYGLPIREKIIRKPRPSHAVKPSPSSNLTLTPPPLPENINTTRITLLNRTLAHLHNTLDTLASSPSSPSATAAAADAQLLGELIQALHPLRLIWPRPAAPFPAVGFTAVADAVEGGLAGYRRRERAERERKRAAAALRVEMEPWYMKKSTAGSASKGLWGGDANGEAPRGWGVIGGIQLPITPAASPEPVYAGARGFEGRGEGGGVDGDGDDSEAKRVVAGLEGLARFGDEVEGLVLEGRLGYLLY